MNLGELLINLDATHNKPTTTTTATTTIITATKTTLKIKDLISIKDHSNENNNTLHHYNNINNNNKHTYNDNNVDVCQKSSHQRRLWWEADVDVQLIYRSFALNVLSARRELTTKHTIAYDISNQHNNKICYAIGHQQPKKTERSPIRSVVVTKFEKETRDRLWLYVFIKKRKKKKKQQLTRQNARQQYMTRFVHLPWHDVLTVPLTVQLHTWRVHRPISAQIGLVITNHVREFCYILINALMGQCTVHVMLVTGHLT